MRRALLAPARLFARVWRAVMVAWLRNELTHVDHDLAVEERRHATHEARMRAWRAHRALLAHRIDRLRGKRQGTTPNALLPRERRA
jgi:hypothetical protein